MVGTISTYVKNPLLLLPKTPVIFRKKNVEMTMILAHCAANKPMICRCTNSVPAAGGGGGELFTVTSSTQSDVDYLGESTKGDLNLNFGINGEASLQGPIEEIARIEAEEAESLLKNLGIPDPFSSRYSPRGIFCSRTLNFRSISAIGYDMDYTLIHYNVMAWEGRAYDYCMDNLRSMGFPVDGLAFDPDLVIRGLVIDKERGNLVKADRFGYVKRAMHGTQMLYTQSVSEMYGRELIDLRKENRWEFLNTLFSVSEAVAYMQMVDRLDEGIMSTDLGPLDYKALYKAVGKALFRAHVEGQLKSEIMSKPELFVEPDPELPLALLDQKEAGKRLLLITNSDYHYTDKMMQHSFNRFLPNDMGWRDLFDMVIVSARKPEFFQMSHPLYEVVTDEGLMRPCFKACPGGVYSGGSAQMIEKSLNIHGDEILYVGDHIYTDVSQSKVHLRWRTALICRELEEEYNALIHSRKQRSTLIELINQKEVIGDLFNQLRLALQRRTTGRPAQTLAATHMEDKELTETIQKLLIVMQRLDQKIAPLLETDGEHFNRRWGFLSRAGLWDKSHLMRQVEKYADIYTSRVSNFLHYTPFMYFRSQEQKFVSSLKENKLMQPSESSLLQRMRRQLRDKSLYALGFCSEMLVTPDDTVLVSLESYAEEKTPRKKAVLHHKFPHHNLIVEAASPGLFIDQHGTYWDVPFTMAIDLASVASDAGPSYHICIDQIAGPPKKFEGQNSEADANILPSLCAKSAFSYKKNIDIWRSKAPKMKLVQPYDVFLSNPHISASGILGAVVSASVGDNLAGAEIDHDTLGFKHFKLNAQGAKFGILADIFASVSLSAQHGNFQRQFLDLTRLSARLDFPSGSKFVSGATRLANDLYSSQAPSMEAVQAICPNATLSFQQQIAGPFSFRVDSGVSLNLKNKDWSMSVKDPVFAIEYALQVLGSAKAVAWYSPNQREFMIELRFFEK